MQHVLKPSAGAAWAQVIATQLLLQFLVAMNNSMPTADVGF